MVEVTAVLQGLGGKFSADLGIGPELAADFGSITEISETDYGKLTNRPFINEHELAPGENSLDSLGIGLAGNADINLLFT